MQSVDCSKNRKEAEMADKNGASTFAIGFIVGAIVGLAIGFLYAPWPGAETRELLKQKGKEAGEKGAEAAEKAKEKASDMHETVRSLTADREKVYKETWKKRKGQPKISDAYFE
jgi:gas vesicle protein